MSCCVDHILDNTVVLYALEDTAEASFREVSVAGNREALETHRVRLQSEYSDWDWKIASFSDALYDIVRDTLTNLPKENQ